MLYPPPLTQTNSISFFLSLKCRSNRSGGGGIPIKRKGPAAREGQVVGGEGGGLRAAHCHLKNAFCPKIFVQSAHAHLRKYTRHVFTLLQGFPAPLRNILRKYCVNWVSSDA